jgi:putative heme-binding domain-containing protein
LVGDAKRGRAWFLSDSANSCKSCHRAEGKGTELGPDLATIAAKYPKRELLQQILEPSRTVDPKYATQVVATKDGQVHMGLLVSKTTRDIVLRDARNQEIRIGLDDIEQQAVQPASLMPDGLLRELTAQQAADLLEYLTTLKSR